jgi:hypothetical protein
VIDGRVNWVCQMLCRFCEKDKSLIKAHVIAQCLHEPLLDSSGPMMLISKDLNSYPKKSPIGQYDTTILCADCDGIFFPWEQYTAGLLTTSNAYDKYKERNSWDDFYVVGRFDYSRLKLCFLSILWRMSVSTLPSFKNVQLGPFEAPIRQMLKDENPGSADEFPIFLVRLIDEIGSGTMRSTDGLRKHHGVNVYDIGLPGYIGIIKVDKRPTPQPLGPRVLASGKPLIIGVKHSTLSSSDIASGFFLGRK